MSNRKVIELLSQLKSAKAHGKNYIKVKPHLIRHLLRNRLLISLKIVVHNSVTVKGVFPRDLEPMMFNIYSMKQPDLYYFEGHKMTSQA